MSEGAVPAVSGEMSVATISAVPTMAICGDGTTIGGKEELTVADGLHLAERSGIFSAAQFRDLRYAVNMVERCTGQKSDALPLTPAKLRPIIAKILPAAHGLKRRTFSNLKSAVATLAIVAGLHDDREALRAPLASPWLELISALGRKHDQAVMAPFFRYCQRTGIAPESVDEEVIERYRAWRTTRTLVIGISASIRATRVVWNKAVGRVAGWPSRKLLPRKSARIIALPKETFPASFRDDLATFLGELGDGTAVERIDVEWTAVRGHTRSPMTIKEYERFAFRAGSILIHLGRDPGSIVGIRDIAHPTSIGPILNEMARRAGNKWTEQAKTAISMTMVMASYVRMAKEDVDKIVAMRERLKKKLKPRKGLAPKILDRMAQFQQPGMIQAYLNLPARMFEAANRIAKEAPSRAADLFEAALALGILIAKPIRRRNLCAIDIERHIRRDANGKIYRISIPGAQTKNGVTIEIRIGRELGEAIDTYLRRHRPRLPGASSTWLFPSATGCYLDPTTLARKVSKLVERQLGIRFNIHMCRHLSAEWIYMAVPEGDAVAQKTLDHLSAKNTARMYTTQRGGAAQEAYTDVVEALRTAPIDDRELAKVHVRKGRK